MAEKSLEQLQKTVEQLQKTVQRMVDKEGVERVMAMHEYYHNALMHKEEAEDIWATEMPDVRFATNTAVFEGEDFKKFYVDHMEQNKKETGGDPGHLPYHCLTTDVIEVAEDGKTATGVWMSPGIVTARRKGAEKPVAQWAWEKYGCDFIKINGKWKLWHLHTYTDFYSPFETSWVDNPKNMYPVEQMMKPTRIVRSYWEYTPNQVAQFLPKPPEPHKTFDPKIAH